MSNDLISRSHFDERVRRVISANKELSADYLDGVDMMRLLLSTEPAINARPVVRGKWLCEGTKCRIGYNDYEYWNKWRCSCCGYIRTEGWEHTSEGKEPKDILICENCGADMRARNDKEV